VDPPLADRLGDEKVGCRVKDETEYDFELTRAEWRLLTRVLKAARAMVDTPDYAWRSEQKQSEAWELIAALKEWDSA